MAIIYRIDITKSNCWVCKLFRRDNLSQTPNEGSCIAIAPTARGAVNDGMNQDDVQAHIAIPSLTYCGSFQPWDGEPRAIIPVVE